jgi:UDPglucose 6-dehydrogenase
VAIAISLVEAGATVRAYDPAAGEAAGEIAGVEVATDPYDACADADALAVLTEWDQFRWLDFERVAASMRRAQLVDTRNLLDPAAMRRLGFGYQGVGR